MKTTLSIIKLMMFAIATGLFPTIVQAQHCQSGTATATLESGNIRTSVLNGGDMFWNLSDARFEVPKGSGKHSIFAGAVWFGGMEAGTTQLNLASQTYRQNGQKGFWPGPLDMNGQITASACSSFNFIAKINSTEIDTFRTRALQGTPIPEAQIPNAVKLWPGKGNPFRSNLSGIGAGQLAPFEDADGDGIYDPRNGDLPSILGNEAVYMIMNDAGNTKTPLTPAAGIEMHVMIYGFSGAASQAVQNTIFARYTLINRGTKTLTDTYFAKWVDLDIGNYLDDYIGADVSRNMYYGYNGDNNDEGSDGYGTNPPAQGVMFLNVPMTNFMMYNNNSSSINGNPTEATDFYYYMQNKWRTGDSITYGGDGIGGTTPASYMFDGDPVAGTGWTEDGAGNIPGDRRGVGSHGPFTFAPGDIKVFDLAFPWARGTSSLNSITVLQHSADAVTQFYNAGLNAASAPVPALALQLYPNPTQGTVQVQFSATHTSEATFTLRDLTGRTVLQEKALIQAGQGRHRLALQQIPNGLYMLQVQHGNSTQTVKVVKQ